MSRPAYLLRKHAPNFFNLGFDESVWMKAERKLADQLQFIEGRLRESPSSVVTGPRTLVGLAAEIEIDEMRGRSTHAGEHCRGFLAFIDGLVRELVERTPPALLPAVRGQLHAMLMNFSNTESKYHEKVGSVGSMIAVFESPGKYRDSGHLAARRLSDVASPSPVFGASGPVPAVFVPLLG